MNPHQTNSLMNIQKDVVLALYSSYKIGGPAHFFAEIENENELSEIDFSKFSDHFILGGGTNLLISDQGFKGLVIHNKIKGIEFRQNSLEIGSGELFSDILDFCIENSLSGLEWAGGLPGTIGAAVRGNAGAFGGETKDSVTEVESIDFGSNKKIKRSNRECEFGYRWSIFKKSSNELITKVKLEVQKGNRGEIKRSIQEKIDYRNLKHPMGYPNIGSTFKNIPVQNISDEQEEEFKPFLKNDPFPVVPTTKLLALAGLKGKKEGDAQISGKHPNFIVNLGNAKASDVLKLIELAKKTVKEKWGIDLEEEIQILK